MVSPVSATVTATTQVELFVLDAEDFLRLFYGSRFFAINLQTVGEQRLAKGKSTDSATGQST